MMMIISVRYQNEWIVTHDHHHCLKSLLVTVLPPKSDKKRPNLCKTSKIGDLLHVFSITTKISEVKFHTQRVPTQFVFIRGGPTGRRIRQFCAVLLHARGLIAVTSFSRHTVAPVITCQPAVDPSAAILRWTSKFSAGFLLGEDPLTNLRGFQRKVGWSQPRRF